MLSVSDRMILYSLSLVYSDLMERTLSSYDSIQAVVHDSLCSGAITEHAAGTHPQGSLAPWYPGYPGSVLGTLGTS